MSLSGAQVLERVSPSYWDARCLLNKETPVGSRTRHLSGRTPAKARLRWHGGGLYHRTG
jgi:hypothetical protein